jgi:hypothetical protein
LRSVSSGKIGAALLLALPAVLTAYFAFNGGGYFAGSTGLAAAVVWVLVALRMVVADRPLAGLGPLLAVAAGALALLAVWALVSSAWSDSTARSLIEFDRALLYLGLLFLFGSLPWKSAHVAWALRGLLLAMLAVGAFALLSRVLPDLVTVSDDIAPDRLSYPLTYWNALGLLLGIGLIFALHFASSEREPPWMRVLGAGAAPVFASALYLTLSRGAIAVTGAGLLLYLLLARPRGALAGLLAVAPACALAVLATYNADLLSTGTPTTAAAVAQGKDAARTIGLSILLALAVRLAGLLLDRPLARMRVAPGVRRSVWAGAGALVLVGLVVCWFALDLGQRIDHQYHGFVNGTTVETGGDVRSRLTDPGNNGRLDIWHTALDAFRREPLHGTGAGTYAITWARERPSPLKAEDAHSLYVELLSELGVPGLLLAVVAILAVMFGFARRMRGPERHLYAALLATGAAWAVHAGIDWDWEMPAVTCWLWAFGGMAVAARTTAPERAGPASLTRVVIALGCLVLAVTPALMAASQARLNDAVAAFEGGDCGSAIDSALGSLDTMPSRPQPFEVLGYCDARLNQHRLAEGAMRSAIDRDPHNWELHYGLALVRADAGSDPRAAARAALRLNPQSPLARTAVRRFGTTNDPQKWRRRAQQARLPIR